MLIIININFLYTKQIGNIAKNGCPEYEFFSRTRTLNLASETPVKDNSRQ